MTLTPSVALVRPLTKREADVLRLALRGHGTKAIAGKLTLSWHTVEAYSRRIDRKIPGNRERRVRWALWAAGCPIEYLSNPE